MSNAIVPIPKVDVTVRVGTMADVPFVNRLQKMHSKAVGFMHLGTLEGKIKAGELLVAEDAGRQPVGYCIGSDRYFKHDDVGIVYHLNVAPGKRRGFVGATMLRAMFERAAYGCKLFCCWCAQDLDANHFWEAMGFVPLAYRAGGKVRMKAEGGRMKNGTRSGSSFIPQPSSFSSRVHIFWQKRIRAGDVTTPWWFPSQTTGGAIREDRLVLPIPPGTHWSDVKPIILPREVGGDDAPPAVSAVERKALPRPRGRRERKAKVVVTVTRRLSFAPVVPPAPLKPEPEKAPREKKPKRKNDPKLVAAARELRDRWLEQVNAGAYVLEDAGKYDVSRALPALSAVGGPEMPIKTTPLLPAA